MPKCTWLNVVVTTDPLCKQGRSGQCTPGEFTPAEVGWMSIMPKAPTPSPLCGVPKDCCSALGNYVVVTLQVRQIHPFLEERETSSSIQRTVKISGAATASPEVDLRAMQFAESLKPRNLAGSCINCSNLQGGLAEHLLNLYWT